MNRESLTNSKVETKKSRKMGVIALLGVCAVAVAAVFGGYEATQSTVSDEAALAHFQNLIEHHQFLSQEHQTLGELIEEGVENQVAIAGAMAAIQSAGTFAKVAAPIV